MADTKISALTEDTAPATTAVVPIVTGGTNKKAQFKNLPLLINYIYPETYGAVGDGNTDDVTAINDALAAAPAGGTVLLGAKSYAVKAAAIQWPVTNNVTLRGVGRGQTKIVSTAYTATALDDNTIILGTASNDAVNGITIKDLTIMGVSASTSAPHQAVFSNRNLTNVTIDNVEFTNIRMTCVNVNSTGSTDWAIKNCYFHGNRNITAGWGVAQTGLINGSSGTGFQVLNNYFELNNVGGAQTEHDIYTSNGTGMLVSGNVFAGAREQVQFYNGTMYNVSLVNNYFGADKNYFDDITGLNVTGNTFNSASVQVTSSVVTFSGNSFKGSGAQDYTISVDGSNFLASGNTFTALTKPLSISSAAGTGIKFFNNYISGGNASYSLINTYQTGKDYVEFVNNTIVNTNATRQCFHVYTDDSAMAHFRCVGNTLSSAGADAFLMDITPVPATWEVWGNTAVSGAFTGVTNPAAILSGGALGTPASGTLTNCTGLPLSGVVDSTSEALGVGSIELGHASDTSIARASAGVITVEGSKVRTRRVVQQASDDATMTSGNAAYNCDTCDIFKWAALAQATDFAATGGTPYEGQVMEWWIQDDGNGPHNLTYSGPFKAGGTTLALPTATVDNTILMLQFIWLTLPTTDSWVLTSKIEAVTVS